MDISVLTGLDASERPLELAFLLDTNTNNDQDEANAEISKKQLFQI